MQHLAQIKAHLELRDKLSEVFVDTYEQDETIDAEHSLYAGGFFSTSDKAQMEILVKLPPEQLGTHPFQFQDSRLTTLLFRYRARNYPLTLTNDEQLQWQQYCNNKLQYGGKGILSAEEFMLKLENLAYENESNEQKMRILKALFQYVQS